MAITGITRALGSALDCITAVAIGVLRVPLSIHQAGYGHMRRLVDAGVLAKGTPTQQTAWTDLVAIRDSHENQFPAGWLSWLIDMRHLNVHRARQIHMWLQKTREDGEPQLTVATGDPDTVNRQMARFELHLRQRPGLSDMQDLVSTGDISGLWINERADVTLSGIGAVTVLLIEEIAHFLLSWWTYTRDHQADFPEPAASWRIVHPLPAQFKGVAPSATPFPLSSARVNPHEAERLKLAQMLRTA
jgi:hypothetical protein